MKPRMPQSAKELAVMIDAAMLRPETTRQDVHRFLEEALCYNFATVFLHPSWIGEAHQLIKDSPVGLGVVIAYPHGAHLSETKLAEINQGLELGADEFDMVANIGRLRSGDYLYVADEIERCRRRCEGKILKVIIETALLSNEEKETAARITADAGADFVKTSTGITAQGATTDDVTLLYDAVAGSIGIKASGGIRKLEQALAMIEAGASRIGASVGRAIVEEAKLYFAAQ